MKKSKKNSVKGKQLRTEQIVHKDKNLNFMVQIDEPKNVRKDILEALREIIIFMQGYETFLKVQEEKLIALGKLQADAKALNSLIENKLKRYLPKGKLKGLAPKKSLPKEEIEEALPVEEFNLPSQEEAEEPESNELEDLELQLKDIEGRLKNIK